MRAAAEAPNAQSTLLAVRGQAASWSVPSTAVVGVERLEDWAVGEPLDVLALLGIASGGVSDDAARVIVVQASSHALPLLAHGVLNLVTTSADQLLDLPQALRQHTPLIERVAVVNGVPALFVLSPLELLDAWRKPGRSASSLPPPARGS